MRLVALAALGCLIRGHHPLHTTHTDLVEGAAGRVTVTVRAFTDDLNAAIAKRGPAAGDSAIARYVLATLEIRDQSGRSVALVWDAARPAADITFLTMHVILPRGLGGSTIRQAMQMELYDDQVNVVQAEYAGRSTSLLFLPGDRAKPLP